MAGKNLYQLLGVAENADVDAITSAYEVGSLKLQVALRKGEPAAVHQKAALDEAFRMLSNPKSRGDYNNRLVLARNSALLVEPMHKSTSFLSTGMVLAVIAAIVAAGGWYYKQRADRIEADRMSNSRKAEEFKLAAERQADRLEQDQRAEANKKRMEEAREYSWAQSARSSAQYNSAMVDSRLRQEQSQSEAEIRRQRAMEESQRRREDAEALQRLENDKRKLRQLECQNYRTC